MFLMHAMYGFGATISPLITTQFVTHVPRFYLYFTVSLGLALVTVGLLLGVSRGQTDVQILGEREPDVFEVKDKDVNKDKDKGKKGKSKAKGKALGEEAAGTYTQEVETKGEVGEEEKGIRMGEESRAEGVEQERKVKNGNSGGKMKRILKTPAVHYMAIYIGFYVSPPPSSPFLMVIIVVVLPLR
jgi:hypothetical protein